MPSFFSRFKAKDGPTKAKTSAPPAQPFPQSLSKPRWEDAWTRKTVDPDEVQKLLRGCTLEIKSRGLDVPFLLLPFRPTSDPSAARTFIRNYFDKGQALHGEHLAQELRLTEPMVLCSVVKWCWSRLPGGVVTWDAYELFRTGENDSNMARDSFKTFIPISVDSDARTKIIFDFFDLLSAIAAHGKSNGLGGRKLSRLAGWWAFEHADTGNGFDGGYSGWASAANATSHLFFAYLRSLSPENSRGMGGISTLPLSLQKLLQDTEYPPEPPMLLFQRTNKVVMIVDSVSPTPFALLRRTNHFEYRQDDRALQEFANYEDPVDALTDECRRVLKSISSTNQSQILSSKQSAGLKDATWSRFEDIGFSGGFDEEAEEDDGSNLMRRKESQGLRSTPRTRPTNIGRPTTPSWADFLSAGFVDESTNNPAPLLLPPDKVLPPIETSRGRSSQSHKPRLESERTLEPGELANITKFDLDEAFWWVWISSLAGEEPAERKAVFGRCALVETVVQGGRWLVIEEMVKGAAPEPAPGTYVAEKKSRFGWSRRNKGVSRRKSTGKEHEQEMSHRLPYKPTQSVGVSKTSIGPDQHARIQAAAAQLHQKQLEQEALQEGQMRRGRSEPDIASKKTNSVFTLQPVIMKEASPAMKWANKYDKDAIREAYLANTTAGRGIGQAALQSNGLTPPEETTPLASPVSQQAPVSTDHDLPALPSSINQSQQEIRPIVPSKSPEPAPYPPTPQPLEPEGKHLSEKAAEVAILTEQHPVERGTVERASPALQHDEPQSEPVIMNEYRAPSAEPPPIIVSPTSSPESKDKHHKLQKKNPGGGGLKKIFGRKNRQSKLPENTSAALNGSQIDSQPKRFSSLRRKNPSTTPPEAAPPAFSPDSAPIEAEDEARASESGMHMHDRSYEPSARESLSRVDTADAREAHQAFSSFDQGPLEDVPAFVPASVDGDSPRESEDAAMPPNVPRHPVHYEQPTASAEALNVMPVQDRWAQIRKNAAERAAQRQSEEQSRGGQSAATNDDGETSGEETIESRVARIKARVAELTGNMDSAGSPGSRSPIRR